MKPESTLPSGAARTAGSLKIVFTDDSPVAREAIGSYLKSHPRVSSVLTCDNGQGGITASLETQPDVVLIDVRMPGLSGFETAGILRYCMPDVAVLMTSIDDSPELRAKCAAHGADAFVPKARFTEQFDAALEKALRAASADTRYREHELRGKPNFKDTAVLASAGCAAVR